MRDLSSVNNKWFFERKFQNSRGIVKFSEKWSINTTKAKAPKFTTFSDNPIWWIIIVWLSGSVNDKPCYTVSFQNLSEEIFSSLETNKN